MGDVRGTLDPLRERNFRVFFAAEVATVVGDNISPVAVAFAVLRATGSPAVLGVVLASQLVGYAAFLLFGGVISGRLGEPRAIVLSDLIRAATQGLFAFSILTGRGGALVFVVLAVINGFGKAAYRPAAVSLIARIVKSKRQQANALLSTTSSLAGVVGPLIGAALIVRWGAGWAIAADAVSFALSAAIVSRLRGVVTARGKTAALRESLNEGWHEVRSRTWVLHSIGVFAAFQFLVLAPLQVLGPVIAERELAGATSWGVLMSAAGVGSFVGAGVALRFRPSRALRKSLVALAATCPLLWLLAIPSSVLILVVASLAYGGIVSFANIVWFSALQDNVPQDVLSRVSSFDFFGSAVLRPLGYFIMGPVSSTVGIPAALAIPSGMFVVLSVVVGVRMREPSPAESTVEGE